MKKNVLSPPLTNFPAILTICFLMAVIQNGHTRTFFKLALTVGLVPSPVLTGPALCYLAAIATIVVQANRTGSCLAFHPNKVPLEILQQVIARLRGPALIVELVRFDIAFDFPCKREAVTLVQDQRRSYRLFREKGAITEYQGARSSHGSLKLYDKTKEFWPFL